MNKTSTVTVFIVGLIVMGVTAGLFFLLIGVGNFSDIDWWAMGIMLFAQFVATLGIAGINSMQGPARPMMMSGGTSALTIYAVIAVIIAFAFRSFLPDSRNMMIGLQLVLFALFAIIVLVLFTNAKRIGGANAATAYAVMAIGGLVTRAETLWRANTAAPYAKSLERLYEDLRYSDNSAMASADQLIHQQLYDLEEMIASSAAPENIEGQIEALKATVRQRGAEVRQIKAGGI